MSEACCFYSFESFFLFLLYRSGVRTILRLYLLCKHHHNIFSLYLFKIGEIHGDDDKTQACFSKHSLLPSKSVSLMAGLMCIKISFTLRLIIVLVLLEFLVHIVTGGYENLFCHVCSEFHIRSCGYP